VESNKLPITACLDYGMVEWNVMLMSWVVLMDSHCLIMTTSEQRPPLNEDRTNFITEKLASLVKHISHL